MIATVYYTFIIMHVNLLIVTLLMNHLCCLQFMVPYHILLQLIHFLILLSSVAPQVYCYSATYTCISLVVICRNDLLFAYHYPVRMHKGKVIGSVAIVIVTRSGDLGVSNSAWQ